MGTVKVRRFRTRVPYGANRDACHQLGRITYQPSLLLAGDIAMNPGPEPGRRPAAVQAVTHAPPATLTAYHANVRSLKKQLGSLRALAPSLTKHDIVSFSETWLNTNVADSELELGFDSHTWFRRDRGSLGGGVACAVRTSLLPVRLPDPAAAEILLVRLQRASLTIAVCYRPPDDDAALERLMAVLFDVDPGQRLLVVGDFNLPEIEWTEAATGDGRLHCGAPPRGRPASWRPVIWPA